MLCDYCLSMLSHCRKVRQSRTRNERRVLELIPVLGSQLAVIEVIPGSRLPLLSSMPVVTSAATEHHQPLAGIKLYCLVTEARVCKQLAQG